MAIASIEAQNALTQERLKTLLRYDPETGDFICLKSRGGLSVGCIAGCPSRTGEYWQIIIDGFKYMAHRLAWLYMKGEWPIATIDHEDLDKRNNRWLNLRPATVRQNCQNMALKKSNKSGAPGVFWEAPRKKWRAQIRRGTDGKIIYLGRYSSFEEAKAVREAAKAVYHPFQPTVPVVKAELINGVVDH